MRAMRALIASETEGDEIFLHYRNLRGGLS